MTKLSMPAGVKKHIGAVNQDLIRVYKWDLNARQSGRVLKAIWKEIKK